MLAPKGNPTERYVFLDTQVFFQHQWDFSNPQFRALVNHAKQLRIASLTTEVTYREIEAHLSERAAVIAAAHDKLRRLARHLPPEHIPLTSNAEWPAEAIRKLLNERLEEFFKETRGVKLSLQEVSVAGLVTDYFAGLPPFGPGRKKDEFPDAIALAAIRAHVAMTNDTFFIVTADNLFMEAASNLPRVKVFKSLAECLTHLSNEVEVEKAVLAAFETKFNIFLGDFFEIVRHAHFVESRLGATVLDTPEPTIVGHDTFAAELSDGFAYLFVDLHCDAWMNLRIEDEVAVHDVDGKMLVRKDYAAAGMHRVTVPAMVVATFEQSKPGEAKFHVEAINQKEIVEFEASEDLVWT
jgi:hypothetical protein